jgi:hypothetical protein
MSTNNTSMEQSLLRIAKKCIELEYQVEIISIDFEDGSGNKFIVVTKSNPLKKQFITL